MFLAMGVASALAMCKDAEVLPKALHWHLNAYTTWNLLLLLLRYIFSVRAWDPFLCVNSVGIFVAYRTAFSQGLDDNIRKKLAGLDLRLTRTQFVIGDVLGHALPAVIMVSTILSQKRRIPPAAVTHAITLATWFSFRQNGSLDASSVYVPHPWKRCWITATLAMLLTPLFVDGLQHKKHRQTLLCVFPVLIGYLSTRMDPKMKDEYTFQFLRQQLALERQLPVSRSSPLLVHQPGEKPTA